MTAVDVPPRAPSRGRDLRSFDRWLTAILMPIGPALVAVIRFTIPGEPPAASVAAAPDAMRATLWLGLVALFALIPGAYAALRLLRPAAPALTRWTAAFLIPGYLGMTALGGLDTFAMISHDVGLDPELTDRIYYALLAEPTTSVALGIFVIGHILGTVLLAITSIRTRMMPLAVGIVFALSQPAHLVAVIITSPGLDLVAWGCTALGMAVLALRAVRTPNDDWDLPARRS